MRYAMLLNGVVENVFIWGGEGDEYESFTVIPLGDHPCAKGWLYSNGIFTDPNARQPPTNAELYEIELQAINDAYQTDTNSLALEYGRAGLFDGKNEAAKKAIIYAKLQARNAQYSADLDALDVKYGG